MIRLDPEEKIDLVAHRHWIAIVTASAFLLALFFVPLAVSLFGAQLHSIAGALFVPLLLFASTIWWLLLLLLFYIELVTWWLNCWIITSKRVIDIQQRGLFRREVSEFPFSRIQDITVETPGIVASLLGYGRVTIQTAGEESFTIRDVNHPERAKECILKYLHVRAFEVGTD